MAVRARHRLYLRVAFSHQKTRSKPLGRAIYTAFHRLIDGLHWCDPLALCASHFLSPQGFSPVSLCLLPVNDLPAFKANATPLKRIVGMTYGSKIKSVSPLVKTDGMKAVRKSESSHIQVVHEFMAKVDNIVLLDVHCLFIGVRIQSRILTASIW